MKDYQENNQETLMIKSMCKELKIEYMYISRNLDFTCLFFNDINMRGTILGACY